ncbi:hypothetical protein FB107DRAFT_252825 [Schizophyllum commune]
MEDEAYGRKGYVGPAWSAGDVISPASSVIFEPSVFEKPSTAIMAEHHTAIMSVRWGETRTPSDMRAPSSSKKKTPRTRYDADQILAKRESSARKRKIDNLTKEIAKVDKQLERLRKLGLEEENLRLRELLSEVYANRGEIPNPPKFSSDATSSECMVHVERNDPLALGTPSDGVPNMRQSPTALDRAISAAGALAGDVSGASIAMDGVAEGEDDTGEGDSAVVMIIISVEAQTHAFGRFIGPSTADEVNGSSTSAKETDKQKPPNSDTQSECPQAQLLDHRYIRDSSESSRHRETPEAEEGQVAYGDLASVINSWADEEDKSSESE